MLAVVGNKIDRTEEEAIGYNEVKQYAESIGAIFKLTSAKDGKGINVTLFQRSNSSPPSLRNTNKLRTSQWQQRERAAAS